MRGTPNPSRSYLCVAGSQGFSVSAQFTAFTTNRRISGSDLLDLLMENPFHSPASLCAMSLATLNTLLADPAAVVDASYVCGRTNMVTIGIVFSVVGETYRFFFDPDIKGKPTVFEFLFGTDWNPQAAMRADQGDIQTAYGFLPLLTGTLLITAIAIAVAGPLGLFSAIYLAEYASPRVRAGASARA